jgi:hypothetical protein
MVRGSLILRFFTLSLVCHFLWRLLALRFFLLVDGLLELFFGFCSSSCASWGLGFEIQTLCFRCQCTHQVGDWETKCSVPWFDCDELLTCRGLNLNPGYFVCFTPICLCGESCFLVTWCVGDRYDMVGSDEDLDRSRRPDAEDWGWSSTGRVLGGRTIRRSGDAVWDLYRAQRDVERGFLG